MRGRDREGFLQSTGWVYVENDEQVPCGLPTMTGGTCNRPGHWTSQARSVDHPMCSQHAVMSEHSHAAEGQR